MDQLLWDLDLVFEKRYSKIGHPSIPPERLLRASFPQVGYSVRSARLLIELFDDLIRIGGLEEWWSPAPTYGDDRQSRSARELDFRQFPLQIRP